MRTREDKYGGGKKLNTAVGRVLGGRYRIEGVLGSGGMAVVYRAEDAVLGRTVALKTLHRHYARGEYFRQRFKQEARAMASLDHENIVKIYDISQDGDVPFIVAECVYGQDLGTLLSGGGGEKLDEPFARKVVSQLLQALSYAHRRGIIHRDIKPSNILIDAEGTIKVADFGIARIVEEEDAEGSGEIIGSARYMSPEQLRGGEATPRSDIYSVGILLYHALTGSPPFSGNLKSLVRQQLHEDPTPPRELNKKVSMHTESVVLRALAKDPADRYPSARAMLDDLESGTADEVVPQTIGIPRRAIRRRGGIGFLAASAFVLLVMIAALWFGASGLGYVDLSGLRGGQESPDRAALVEGNASDAPAAPDVEAAARAGEDADLVPVPNVNTYFDYWAEQTLNDSGFRVKVVYEYRNGYANRGVTWATEPAVGTLAPEGSTVTVYATPKDLYQPQL